MLRLSGTAKGAGAEPTFSIPIISHPRRNSKRIRRKNTAPIQVPHFSSSAILVYARRRYALTVSGETFMLRAASTQLRRRTSHSMTVRASSAGSCISSTSAMARRGAIDCKLSLICRCILSIAHLQRRGLAGAPKAHGGGLGCIPAPPRPEKCLTSSCARAYRRVCFRRSSAANRESPSARW